MSDYFEEIKKQYPYITPYKEDDEVWEIKGYEHLCKGNYIDAMIRFKKLILSQPEHYSGYEGLSYAYYYLNELDKAKWFMEKALKIAKGINKKGSLERDILEDIQHNFNAISKKGKILKWWIKF
jgi:tetratricopeptide (TPR) repeat protein